MHTTNQLHNENLYMKIKNLKKQSLLALVCLVTLSNIHAAAQNFTCPQPQEIQSTDFTAPSIWTAPPVAHSVDGMVGVGLGGKEVKEFLGAEAATVNHKAGWVCVYRSQGGLSVNEYESKIREIVGSNTFLKKYLAKVNKSFEDAQPYLKNYPKETPLGFIGYQKQ